MRRKVLLVAVLIFAMLLQCVMPLATANAASSVEITLNSKLYEAVKADLLRQNIAADFKDANKVIVISESELESITSLSLRNKGINDLTGLDAFKNLTSLDLHANQLTSESHLEVLSSLGLKDLDLSSNKIESVRSIANFNDIEHADITNQKVTGREIIVVDTSEDAEERPQTVEVQLPDILLEDGNQINANWIDSEIIKDGLTGPDVDWEHSIAKGSTTLVLKVASGEGTKYAARKGLVKVVVKVEDDGSKLANTEMAFYYAVVDEEETGIAFNDKNLYNAVKEQLTNKQKVNEELDKSELTQKRNLYERAYDEALILVIKSDDVANNITALVLNDERIEDLTGIEKFVGLKSYLNVSHNYIDTIDRIVELERNKALEEARIREKYQKALTKLQENVANYDEQQRIIKEADENIKRVTQEENEATDASVKASKLTEKQGYLDQKAKAEELAKKYLELMNKYSEKLYKIYKNEHRLVSLLPLQVNYLSYSELFKADLNTAKQYASSIMERVSALEKGYALTVYENFAITKFMKAWGEANGLSFETEKTEYVAKAGEEEPEEVQVPIEFPISEFFEKINQDETLDLEDWEQFIYIYKAIDTLSQIEQYTIIRRTFDKNTEDNAAKALEEIKEFLKEQDLDTYFYELVKYESNVTDKETVLSEKGKTGNEAFVFDNTKTDGGFFQVRVGLGKSEYSGTVGETSSVVLALSHRQNAITSEDIENYIVLPRIQCLDISNNNIETLEGLDTLTRLKALYSYKNEVNDISNVNWSGLITLRILDLGYNQISDIEPLEVLLKMEELYLSHNLLSGAFTFNLQNMEYLRVADFSYNQLSDIQYVNNQFILKAKGYDSDGDGFANKLTVPEYLKAAGINLSFKYQQLEMSVTIVKTEDEFVYLDLPLIFKQLEEMDTEHTSFGLDSINGLVDAKGEYVKLKVPEQEGTYRGRVTVEGENGYYSYPDNHKTELGGHVEDRVSIGFGTFCEIKYDVVGSGILPDDPTTPDDPTKPDTPPVEGAPESYGYDIEEEYVLVYEPKTTVNQFVEKLVDTTKYKVTVTENNGGSKLGTGAVVTVTSLDGTEEYAIFEVVVKGDINGDGDVDALDSGIIREVIADTTKLVGSFKSAADITNDGEIDSQDSMLILQFRADRISDFNK